MGLAILIDRGVQALRSESASLAAEIGELRAAAALAALDRLHAVLEGLNLVAWSENSVPRDRAALSVALSYGFRTDDLVPARGERVLMGVLDDAYLAFAAAAGVAGGLPGISTKDLIQGRDDLAAALSPDVVATLDHQLAAALDAVEAYAKDVS